LTQIPMFVEVEQPVKQPITKLSVLVQRDTPVTHSSVVDHLRRRIFATPTLVDLELSVKLVLIDPEQTDLCAHVQLVTEVILSSGVPEESV